MLNDPMNGGAKSIGVFNEKGARIIICFSYSNLKKQIKKRSSMKILWFQSWSLWFFIGLFILLSPDDVRKLATGQSRKSSSNQARG